MRRSRGPDLVPRSISLRPTSEHRGVPESLALRVEYLTSQLKLMKRGAKKRYLFALALSKLPMEVTDEFVRELDGIEAKLKGA